MSPRAKYLIFTNNDQPCKLELYIWSAKQQNAAATVKFDQRIKTVLNVCFSKRCDEYIAVTTPSHIIFLTFDMGNHVISYYNPKTNRYWPTTPVEYTCSTYDDELNLCYSASSSGDLAFWSDDSVTNKFLDKEKHSEINAPTKMTNQLDGKFFLRLHKYKIIKLSMVDRYLVCLDDESFITFYDQNLKSVYVFSDIIGDKIIDFQMNLYPRYYRPTTYEKSSLADSAFLNRFTYPERKVSVARWQDADSSVKVEPEEIHTFNPRDIIIQTINNQLVYLNPVQKKIYSIFEDSINNASAIEVSPVSDHLYIGTLTCEIYLYDYLKKERLFERKLTPKNDKDANVSCLKFSTNGNILACGMSDGTLYCLEPTTLLEIPEQDFNKSKTSIHTIEFCNESRYLAYADKDYIIALFTIEPKFSLIGMFRAHYKPITDVTFTVWDSVTKMYSIGRDGYLNEYDLKECEENQRLTFSRRILVEKQTEPLAIVRSPACSKMLIISMSCSHFRFLDTDSMNLADVKKSPSLDDNIDIFLELHCGNVSGNQYYLFASGCKIGLIKGPLDGNPFKWMTIRAGTSKITELCASREGYYAFSIIDTDAYVQMWKITPSNLDFLERIGGRGLKPYFALLKGGKKNPIITQLQELFCLALMQHQGLYKLEELEVSNNREITLCEVPSILRGMGAFPTNMEIESLLNMNSLKSSLISNQRLTFNCFAAFFFNLYHEDDYTYHHIEKAFRTICSYGQPENVNVTEPMIRREDFIKVLEEEGEKFSPFETYNLLRTLVGHKEGDRYFYGELEDISNFKFLPPKISFQYFVAKLIGFGGLKYDESEEVPDEMPLNLYEAEPFLIKEVNAK
ncbi:cilia- and flagella-associated protein 251-like isoform X2 [Rhodnius prolixus]